MMQWGKRDGLRRIADRERKMTRFEKSEGAKTAGNTYLAKIALFHGRALIPAACSGQPYWVFKTVYRHDVRRAWYMFKVPHFEVVDIDSRRLCRVLRFS